jgi:uncharacterized protein (TIGR03382 family)
MVRQPIVSFDRSGDCSIGDRGSSPVWPMLLLPLALWLVRRVAPRRR